MVLVCFLSLIPSDNNPASRIEGFGKIEFIEKPQSELAFGKQLIDYLQHIGGTKQWEYRADTKTTEGLWTNFREILERNNWDKLQGGLLSDQEFAQAPKEICALT